MILADKIIASESPQLQTFKGDVLMVPKYRLTADAVKAAFQVQTAKPSSVIAAMEFCRTPYPKIWIEWGQADTVDAGRNQKAYPMQDARPGSVGILLDMDETGRKGVLSLAWDWEKRNWVRLSPLAIDLDVERMDTVSLADFRSRVVLDRLTNGNQLDRVYDLYTRSDDEMSHMAMSESQVQFIKSPYYPPNYLDDVTDESWAGACADWYGEIGLVQSALILMNCRNCVETEAVDLIRLNRARAKNGKPALAEHHVIKLHFRKRQAEAMARKGMTNSEIKRHLVSGHYKLRKRRDGTARPFWWSPHLRGYIGVARVPDYEVQP